MTYKVSVLAIESAGRGPEDRPLGHSRGDLARWLHWAEAAVPLPPDVRMDSTKINIAVRECLDRCYKSDQPLNCLADFTLRLRDDPDWRDAEVQEFETAVRRVLSEVLDA